MTAFRIFATQRQWPIPRFAIHFGFVGLLLAVPGCGHLMLRSVSPNHCESSLIDCVDPVGCETPEGLTFNRFRDAGTKLQLHRERTSEKLAVCSARLQDCWQNSKIEQWKAERREKLTAPPNPRFHPLPTHPVFFPEDSMMSQE